VKKVCCSVCGVDLPPGARFCCSCGGVASAGGSPRHPPLPRAQSQRTVPAHGPHFSSSLPPSPPSPKKLPSAQRFSSVEQGSVGGAAVSRPPMKLPALPAPSPALPVSVPPTPQSAPDEPTQCASPLPSCGGL
jgi:hypothetical protein